jgi:hypothetical protein
VKAKEIMAKPDELAVPKTTIFIGRRPVAELPFGRIRHIHSESGFAFIYPMPRIATLMVRTDGLRHPTYSRTLVLEDGKPIGPSHELHDTIRKVGRGAYSHWSTGWIQPSTLYFSTTDNTSAVTNGRTYSIEYNITPHPGLAVLIVLVSWPFYVRAYIGLSWLVRRLSHHKSASKRKRKE